MTLWASEARGSFCPGVALYRKVVTHLEQCSHICGLEGLLELLPKAIGDIGEIKVKAVALGDQIDSVEVAYALGPDQGRNRTAGDAEYCRVPLRPLGPQAGVADDV